ncbi:MAG: hypothetical protein K5678_03570, partial [Acetatifactor sp.]|nr:hypothetical protein [Acetatifactor sp.]
MQNNKSLLFKYYLRGVGTGLAIAVLLLAVAGAGKMPSDPGKEVVVIDESKGSSEPSQSSSETESTTETSEYVDPTETD